MHAKSGHRAKSASDDAFDVRILAFAGARAQHVRGLQDILGVDAATAQRIVDAVPSVVRRAAPKHEAQDCSRALQNIGARVVVEQTQGSDLGIEPVRRPAPPPTRGAGPPPPPRPAPPSAAGVGRPSADHEAARRLLELSEPPLPRPILRTATVDLEFDMPSMDDVEDQDFSPGAAEPEFALDQLDGDSLQSDLETEERTRKAVRKSSRDEIDLESAGGGSELDLLQVAAPRRAPLASLPSAGQSQTHRASIPQTARAQTARTQTGNIAAREPSGAQRMPVIERAPPAEQSRAQTLARATRSRALLQLLAATVIIAMGLHFDSSVFYGNASLFSVVAHGLAFQQLGFGVLGLFR